MEGLPLSTETTGDNPTFETDVDEYKAGDNPAFENDDDENKAAEEEALATLNASIEDLQRKIYSMQDGLSDITEEGSHIKSYQNNEFDSALDMDEDDAEKLERKKKRERIHFDSDPEKRIDYVLVYKDDPEDEEAADKESCRKKFEANLEKAGCELEREDSGDDSKEKSHCVKVHVTWPTVLKIATMLYMPKRVKMPKDYQENNKGCCANCCSRFEVDDAVFEKEDDYFTAKFDSENINMFDLDPDDPEDRKKFFTPSERSAICKELLDRATYSVKEGVTKFGISRMLGAGMYTAAFPLHEGPVNPLPDDPEPWVGDGKDRARLYEAWARAGKVFSYQPLDLIRKYFGEKVGIYFAWLGFYTQMLIPASVAGLAVFIYGLVTLFDDDPSQDICNESRMGDTNMCPLCDLRCPFWKLKNSCVYSRITYIFDNSATVAFAIFMSVWSTIFLEFWYRKQKEIQYDWDVASFEMEERIRPEFEFKVTRKKKNPVTKEEEPHMPSIQSFCRKCTSFSIVLFWVCLVIAAIVGVVIYRIVIAAIIYDIQPNETVAKLGTTISASVISLLVITALNLLYGKIAVALTDLETPRTWTEYEDSLTTKMFLFQFVNYYGSIFYIAFFKGRFNLVPGVTKGFLFGRWRQDTCDASGCFVDLFIQLAIIMVGKQFLNNAKEIIIPWLLKFCRSRKSSEEETDENLYMRWEQDRDMTEQPKLGLFDEYLEMVIQYGFVTIFVAAFPLAPLFALINNIIEIRLDAYKLVVVWRRSTALKAQDIGAWYGILQGITFIAVITNAFIIGYTSEFVPKVVYILTEDTGTLQHYLNHSLSVQRIERFENRTFPNKPGINVTDICRYRGYIEDSDTYNYTEDYWKIFTARLAFVIVFEHAVFLLTWIVSYIIPDVPHSVKQLQLHERALIRELRYRATMPVDDGDEEDGPINIELVEVDNNDDNDTFGDDENADNIKMVNGLSRSLDIM